MNTHPQRMAITTNLVLISLDTNYPFTRLDKVWKEIIIVRDCNLLLPLLHLIPTFMWGRCTQTRHNFVGEIRSFSVKIRINPYPSYMHQCIAKTFTRFISRCSFCKKIATLCNKNRHPAAINQNRSFTSRGATVGLGLRL